MMISRGHLRVCAALLVLCVSGLQWHASADTDPTDVTALQTLYRTWSGTYSHIPVWSGDDPCGSNWPGVVCDGPTGTEVTKLALASMNLTGGIPSAIGDLASLVSLELSFNSELGGTLPTELGQLTSLSSLSIMNSGLTGNIPSSLGNCVNLTFLALNQNDLTGPIPDVIGKLNQLFWFDVSENSIGGPLPVSTQSTSNIGLDNLTSAQHFHFYNNSITGSIPPEIFSPPSLLHVLLDGNLLQGSIPTTVANARSLQLLRVDDNKLSGLIPAELGQVVALQQLQLSNNNFSGPLPDLSSLTNLLLLDLSNNPFTPQEVPAWIYSMNKVQTLFANSVNFTGALNPSIFSLASLQTLSLIDNQLNGTLTFSGDSTSSLVLVDLQNNEFYGLVGVSAPAVDLRLAGNPLCSSTLFQGNNDCRVVLETPSAWTPPASSCKQSCGEKTLNPNDCSCSFPLTLNMQLTSPPFSSVNTTEITSLEGELAQSFQLDTKQVSIGYANFTTDNRMLFDVLIFPASGNALDPRQAVNISSALSHNAIGLQEGPYILIMSLAPPLLAPSKGSSVSIGVIIGIVVAAVVVAGIIAIIVLYAVRQKRRADNMEGSQPFASWGTTSKRDTGAAPQLKGARWFSLLELKRATNNFDTDNGIGIGGYGKVYKANLQSGDVVAVKRAEEGSLQGGTEFKNEIELLSRVHHRNLVGLVGFCYEDGEQMLVYEYMPNGTLRDHLLGHTDVPLTWESRVAIALGSAKGLAYLHELANPPIIHRDVKSSNILLDEKMVAKVADFGLSKLAPNEDTKKHVSTQVKGTLGYLDPEYYMTNQLSEKSDVYSFGVVLLEILTARQPIEHGRYVVREVRTALNKGGIKALAPLLDPFLGDYPMKQLEALLDLALRCVEEAAIDRPRMMEVVKELEVIAGHSQANSDVHITLEPQKSYDFYSGKDSRKKAADNEVYLNNSDPSFQYSGSGFLPAVVEPK